MKIDRDAAHKDYYGEIRRLLLKYEIIDVQDWPTIEANQAVLPVCAFDRLQELASWEEWHKIMELALVLATAMYLKVPVQANADDLQTAIVNYRESYIGFFASQMNPEEMENGKKQSQKLSSALN